MAIDMVSLARLNILTFYFRQTILKTSKWRPPPRNGTNFHQSFYPTFFICNWILHIWNGFFTWSQSKISRLSPLKIGSKLTFSGCCDRRLPYNSHVHSHLNYYIYIKKSSHYVQTRFSSQGVILGGFQTFVCLQNTQIARETHPPFMAKSI